MTQATPDRAPQGRSSDEDYDLALWSEVLAMMASTYELASKLEGLNLSPEKIMDLARGFADEFMRRRAALLEDTP